MGREGCGGCGDAFFTLFCKKASQKTLKIKVFVGIAKDENLDLKINFGVF